MNTSERENGLNKSGPDPDRRIYVKRVLNNGSVVREYISGSLRDVSQLLENLEGKILELTFMSRDVDRAETMNEQTTGFENPAQRPEHMPHLAESDSVQLT
ncbi:MAG: hypothetical protein C4523_01470 [Myxococcales bacterium]|nr:MAG: hypothetical protein C4523_01470 [Myxococcales bacterium]